MTQNDTGSSVSSKVLICCTYVIKRTVVCILSISKLQNYVCLLTALEALFVPFQSTGNPLFCSVNGFATFRAFWMFHGLERHFYTEKEKLCYLISPKLVKFFIKLFIVMSSQEIIVIFNYYFLLLCN